MLGAHRLGIPLALRASLQRLFCTSALALTCLACGLFCPAVESAGLFEHADGVTERLVLDGALGFGRFSFGRAPQLPRVLGRPHRLGTLSRLRHLFPSPLGILAVSALQLRRRLLEAEI